MCFFQVTSISICQIKNYHTIPFILHGYLPADFMKTAIVPITLKKTGDTSDKNNYRPIALVSTASKVDEICILGILETYLQTHLGLSLDTLQTCVLLLLKV